MLVVDGAVAVIVPVMFGKKVELIAVPVMFGKKVELTTVPVMFGKKLDTVVALVARSVEVEITDLLSS